jgi:RNA methyltransferase, TrmH family
MITSKTNSHLSEIRKLARASARSRSGRFVAEGEDLNEAADAARITPLYVLAAQGFEGARGSGWLEVSPQLLSSVSTIAQGSRVVGVYEQRWVAPAGRVVALWGVGDPGNVGTVLRAVHAFGADCLAVGPQCADPYSPKAVRASVGAIFGASVARFRGVDELPRPVVALVAGASKRLAGPREGDLTLLVGGERTGLPAEVLAQCDEVRSIPQVAGDSLNAAMAATVALYEVTRMAPR